MAGPIIFCDDYPIIFKPQNKREVQMKQELIDLMVKQMESDGLNPDWIKVQVKKWQGMTDAEIITIAKGYINKPRRYKCKIKILR